MTPPEGRKESSTVPLSRQITSRSRRRKGRALCAPKISDLLRRKLIRDREAENAKESKEKDKEGKEGGLTH